MARNVITFLVNLRKNKNTASKTYGQYYPEAEPKEPLSLKGFARHRPSMASWQRMRCWFWCFRTSSRV